MTNNSVWQNFSKNSITLNPVVKIQTVLKTHHNAKFLTLRIISSVVIFTDISRL